MVEIGLVQQLGLLIIGATLMVVLVDFLKGPSIVAYILAGLLMGPVLGIVEVGHDIEVLGEFGIVLLLFLVGLELSLDKVKKVGKVAVIAGCIQMGVTAAGGFAISWGLGFELVESMVMAIGLTFSSTVVVTKLLDQKGDLDTLYGRIAIGIFLVQDIAVIIALTVLAGIDDGEGTGAEELDLAAVAGDIGIAFLGMGGLLVVALAAARWVFPKPFKWAARRPEAVFIWSLAWCFILVYASELMGLSEEIGAFLAGLSLAQLPYNEDLKRRVHPLMNFFIAVFFVWLGLQLELEHAFGQLDVALILSGFVLIGKFVIFMVIISRMGYDERVSFSTSVTVSQISEFGFIFAAAALGVGLIDELHLSIIALVGVVTISISAYFIVYTERVYEFVSGLNLLAPFQAKPAEDSEIKVEHADHVIVVGMNELGVRLIERLAEQGEEVVAIDNDYDKLVDLPCETVLGDALYQAVLKDGGLQHAKLLISPLRIEEMNRLLAYHGQRAGVATAIHAIDDSVVEELQKLEVDYIIDPRRDGVEREWEKLREVLAQSESTDA